MKKLVPACILFTDRPRSFITELQAARLQWLLDSPERKRKEKQLNKAPKAPRAGKKTKKLSELDQKMLSFMEGLKK